MSDTALDSPRNYMLLIVGEADKNHIVSSYDEFVHEFGEHAGAFAASNILYVIEGKLYVVQAKVFDDAKLEEVTEFGKNVIYELHCTPGQETMDMQLWMCKLAEKMNTVAYLNPIQFLANSTVGYKPFITKEVMEFGSHGSMITNATQMNKQGREKA